MLRCRLVPEDRPRYLMGVGEPDDLVEAVWRGVDIFDCVMPTRVARHGAALTPDGRVNVGKKTFERDHTPLQFDCTCYCCQHFGKAYLRHLVKAGELLAHYLLSIHNIHFLVMHMRNLRQAIIEGRSADYGRRFLSRYLQTA